MSALFGSWHVHSETLQYGQLTRYIHFLPLICHIAFCQIYSNLCCVSGRPSSSVKCSKMTELCKVDNNRLTHFLHFFCLVFVVVIFRSGPILCALSVTTSGISRSGTSSIKPFTNTKTSSAFSLSCLGTLSILKQSLRPYCSNSS